MAEETSTNLRVGIFVILALAIGGGFVFALGAQKGLFDSTREYHAIFDDVGGLIKGNAVRIAGVQVGSVEEVRFMDDGRVDVYFTVREDATGLVRGIVGAEGEQLSQSSQVTVGSRGMLGDRLIDITAGDTSLPEWPVEQPLPVDTSGDLMAMATNVASEVEDAVANVQRLTETLGSEEFNDNLLGLTTNLSQFMYTLTNGEGAIPRLMTSRATADRLDATLENFQATSAEFRRTARSLRGIAQEIERGDGSAHALIYGDDARIALENIGTAAGEAGQMLNAIRTGDGTLHDLIYEQDAEDMIANMTQVTEDLAAMTADIRAGRGTIGGLLVDPSIYEDVKRLVGDLERNDILRSLVRYSIRRDAPNETNPDVEE